MTSYQKHAAAMHQVSKILIRSNLVNAAASCKATAEFLDRFDFKGFKNESGEARKTEWWIVLHEWQRKSTGNWEPQAMIFDTEQRALAHVEDCKRLSANHRNISGPFLWTQPSDNS